MTTILPYVLYVAFTMIGLALVLNCYMLFSANSTIAYRLVSLDTITSNVVALLLLYGIKQHTQTYFEVALLFSLFGYVSTVVLSKYILHKDIVV